MPPAAAPVGKTKQPDRLCPTGGVSDPAGPQDTCRHRTTASQTPRTRGRPSRSGDDRLGPKRTREPCARRPPRPRRPPSRREERPGEWRGACQGGGPPREWERWSLGDSCDGSIQAPERGHSRLSRITRKGEENRRTHSPLCSPTNTLYLNYQRF